MPTDNVVFRAGDKDDRSPPKPYSIDVNDVVYLIADRGDGPYAPEPGCEVPKRSGGHIELCLGPLREQPSQEQLESFWCPIVSLRG